MTEELEDIVSDKFYELHGDYSYTDWNEWSGTSYKIEGILFVINELLKEGFLTENKQL